MHYTQFVFYANTPFVNALKTIHFRNNIERDNFFDTVMSGHKVLDMRHEKYNMVRDRLTVRVDWSYDKGSENSNGNVQEDMIGVNYCYFYDSRSRKRYYCQVVSTKYINEKVTEFKLSVDILMTYFQGDFVNKIGNVHIKRQHITNKQYEGNVFQIAHRDKYSTSPLQVIHQKHHELGRSMVKKDHEDGYEDKYIRDITYEDIWLIFQCSADLSSDFGDIDEPKFTTSEGSIMDKVTSPVNIYAINMADGNKLFKELGDFPWISQNIKTINMIPVDFIDKTDFQDVRCKSIKGQGLKVPKFDVISRMNTFKYDGINYDFDYVNELLSNYTGVTDILKNEKHIYNSSYIKYYVTNWAGSNLELQPEKLSDTEYNLSWTSQCIIGYDNKIVFYPNGYNSHNENTINPIQEDGKEFRILVPKGEYTGASLVFNSWDTLPIMIDNYKMSLSSNAYQRKLTEDSMIGNQWENLKNGGGEDYSWWESAMRIGGTIFGGSGQAAASGFATGGIAGGLIAGGGSMLFNGFNYAMSEKDYYRQKQANQNQAKLARPTETNQNMGNSFAYKNGSFGISVKMYAIQEEDFVDVLKYHKAIGYQWDKYEQPSSLMSMSHVNYLEFDGEWYMDDIPTDFMKLAKDMFKQGVSFYHNPEGKVNPFNDDILNNHRVM